MTLFLPGLRGNDPLGFLAAVGLISLSEQGEIPDLRLAWGGGGSLIANVEGDVDSIEKLSGQLRSVFERVRRADAAIPGVPRELPLKKTETKDPMRMSREQMRQLYLDADAAWAEGRKWVARWMVALTAQTAPTRDAKRGDVQLTDFYAPTGQMAMRTSIFEKTMTAVERVGGPGDALTGWRRISYDGANFDERAKRDAGVTTSGEPDNQGAPSATWLAAMGMRFFCVTDDGRRTATVGWQHIRMYRGYTKRSLIWPVWGWALEPAAVRLLLAHPAMRLHADGNRVEPDKPRELQALGVTHVFGSSRRTLAQGDGPLGPARLIWAASAMHETT